MEPLSLPARLESLAKIGTYVARATTEAQLSPKAAHGLRLAVDEIATNIVTHGHQEPGICGEVTVQADWTECSLTVVLEDGGPPFNPLNHRTPGTQELGLPLEERRIGGLGIFFALKSVDTFKYERTPQLNRNIFIVNRIPSGTPR